jgi:hypothetical protein
VKVVVPLARVSVAAALGKDRALRREIRDALKAGMTAARLDEALLQLIPFAGYARAINAFAVLQELAPHAPRPLRPRGDLRRRGEAPLPPHLRPVYDG